MVLLYGNVPIRKDFASDHALKLIKDNHLECFRTLTPVERMHPDWMCNITEGNLIVRSKADYVQHRQQLSPLYIDDGTFVIYTRQSLLGTMGTGSDFVNEFYAYVVDSSDAGVEINSKTDYEYAKFLLKHKTVS